MSFNLESLFHKSVESIRGFAGTHTDETFYAFAIDENLLCLNSIEQFERTLQRYRDRDQHSRRVIASWADVDADDIKRFEYMFCYDQKIDQNNTEEVKKFVFDQHNNRLKFSKDLPPSHQTPREVAMLRANTGDWSYQGFAELTEADGFDFEANDEFNDLEGDPNLQMRTAYGKAMRSLIDMIGDSGIFELLRRTPNFYATVVSHNCVEIIE